MEILITYNSDGEIIASNVVDEATKEVLQNEASANGNSTLVHDISPRPFDKVIDGKVVSVPPAIPTRPTLEMLREERDRFLLESDWTQMPDSPLSDSKKAEWATYRQQLRDLPSSYTDDDDITNVTWPTRPE
tara:strand:+ start:1138 stop:1533 length:396 start_codon:yes stop_codon:yes gene_type:complete